MQIEYDEKGKLFTEVIAKDKIWCHIQAESYYILGNVHVRVGDRLSDELNRENNFLAITEAEVYSPGGELLYSNNFLAVNRKHVVWLMPVEKPLTSQEMAE